MVIAAERTLPRDELREIYHSVGWTRYTGTWIELSVRSEEQRMAAFALPVDRDRPLSTVDRT